MRNRQRICPASSHPVSRSSHAVAWLPRLPSSGRPTWRARLDCSRRNRPMAARPSRLRLSCRAPTLPATADGNRSQRTAMDGRSPSGSIIETWRPMGRPARTPGTPHTHRARRTSRQRPTGQRERSARRSSSRGSVTTRACGRLRVASVTAAKRRSQPDQTAQSMRPGGTSIQATGATSLSACPGMRGARSALRYG